MILIALELLKNNWKIVLAAVATLTWSLFCYHQGKETVQDKWNQSILEATAKARQIEKDNALISNIIGGKYESSIKTINDEYNTAIGMQPASSGMSRASRTSAIPTTTTCADSVYKANKRELLRLGKEAEINTQKLIHLQEWVKSIK